MSMKYEAQQIYSWLYRIQDPLGVGFYLIEGADRALLFDTGFGVGDIPGAVKSLTDKPLTVVLGHGHVDHANGAYQFDEVLMHEADFELCRLHSSPEFRDNIIKGLTDSGAEFDFDPSVWRLAGTGNLKKLAFGTVFDLGGLHVEFLDMAGHTAGSSGLLIAEHRLLLDSDSANEHCWMFLDETLPIREYITMLERVSQLDFDIFYTAHSDAPHPKSDFQRYINVARNASVKKSEPYSAGEMDMSILSPYVYTEDGVSIVFSERTLNG